MPSTYPKLEYSPSRPQSTTQPEMIDVVKTWTKKHMQHKQSCWSKVAAPPRGAAQKQEKKEPKSQRTGMTDDNSPDSLHDRY